MTSLKLAPFLALCGILGVQSGLASDWKDLSGKDSPPRLVVLSNAKTHPAALPFIPERMKEAGLWQTFSDPKVIAKLAQTMSPATATGWDDTGLWMHLLLDDGEWLALSVCEKPGAAQGGVKAGDTLLALHPSLWKNLQSSRPAASATADKGDAAKAKTGAFEANLGELDGPAMTPDDRKANPFLKYDGDIKDESAEVLVPDTYDGTKPFGLMVYITPAMDGNNAPPGGWRGELASREIIWIGAKKGGNNHPGDRRVWLAQHARAWALHHYKIDPARMIIAGFSNGGDSASGTAVATPFGFNNAILFAPPCAPPLGPVGIPQEKDAKGPAPVIQPLSGAGIRQIKTHWRIAYVVGTKDSFVPEVRKSAKAVEGLDCGSKLFEIDGLGHGVPQNITDILDFILEPRAAGGGNKKEKTGFDPGPVVSNILAAHKTNPARAREMMLQLWQNHPESRGDDQVTETLELMEKLP